MIALCLGDFICASLEGAGRLRDRNRPAASCNPNYSAAWLIFCDEDSECSTISPDIHQHPEYQLLLLANPDEFAEGRVSFRIFDSDAVAPNYGASPVYSLTLTNGHLPSPEFEDAADDADRKRRAKCQLAVTKEVRKLNSDHYKRLDKCMRRVVEAEELGGKEEKVD